ncbi:MAG: hypothetical protein PVI26_02710, partial [Chitinispirillia bacterium]
MNKKIFFVILSAGLLISCTKELKVFVSEKHPNGSKKKEIHYYTRQTDPRRIVIYGENGNIKSDQYMKNGKPDSLTVIYHNNGNKYKEVMYIQDPETKKEMKHGKEISWYENGNVKTEASFENGLPTGTAVTYYEDGKKASQVSFQNGKKQGEETYWYSNGNK